MAPPPPFIYLSPTEDGTGASTLLSAAFYGNLGRLKGAKRLGIEKGKARDAVLALSKDGIGLLHAAACQGHLNVCKFLVEELGGDVNIAGAGLTPFMAAAESGDAPTVEYFLDHGGDVTKTDDKRCTVLHHDAGIGCCKVTEFLLSKGVPVDINCGLGTPLFHAANNDKDKALNILLDHQADPNVIVNNGACSLPMSSLVCRSLKCMKLLIKAGADVNGKDTLVFPLMFAASQGGYTNFIKFLLKAGANPNIPDDLGWLPVEHAALRDFKEEVEMLFPLTSPIPNVPEWSVNGIISHAKVKDTKPIAIDHGPTTVLYTNRSICRLLVDDGEDALSDGNRCRMMRPNWAKACYCWGAGHMLLKEYKHVSDTLMDAQKLDPGSVEIEKELREYGLQESKDVTVPAQDMESKDGHYEKPTTTYGDKPPNISSVMKKIQVFVKHPHGTLSLQIDTNKDVEFLREEVEQRMQLDVSGYFFTYDLSTLEAGKPLSSYGIEKDSSICMRARLRGGQRFHGGRKLHCRKRFHGRRKSKTLSQFFLKHGEEFLRTVKLPDGSTSVELTELGCSILSSLIHLFTTVFVAGKSWDGIFDMDSFKVVRGRVRIKKKTWKKLNSHRLQHDCTELASMIRVMFVRKNGHPPYLLHLLWMLDALAVDVFTVKHQLIFDLHMSLFLSLNRVSLVYQIKRNYDGWHEDEKQRFRAVANKCILPENLINDLIYVPLFHDVIVEGQKISIAYNSNGMGAFHLVRNYNTHATQHSWIHLFVDSTYEDYQWFECNSGVELMVPKYLGDFLAEVVVMFIQENFDIIHALMTCSALEPYISDLSSGSSSSDSSSDSSSSGPSPRKRKRRNSVSCKNKRSQRCSSYCDSSTSGNPSKKRKRSHSTQKNSSRRRGSKKCKPEH